MVWSKMKTRDAPVLYTGAWVSLLVVLVGMDGEIGGTVRVFQQLLCLGVVDGFDVFVVEEVFLHALVAVDLEAVSVKGVLVFLTADVLDDDVQWFARPLVRLRLSDVGRLWLAPVAGIFVVIQLGENIVGFTRGTGGGYVGLGLQRLERGGVALGLLDFSGCHVREESMLGQATIIW